MGFKLLDKPKTVRITKKLAERFAEMDPAPHDRPLSERRLQVYRGMLKEGGFRPVSWASALCEETNQEYRVNGKHTATLFFTTDPLPEAYAVVEEYACDTLEDVAKLYATYDSGLQSRSARDIYLSFAACVPELKGVAARTIQLAVAGIDMALHGLATSWHKRNQPADRAEALLDHTDFVLWLADILSTGVHGSNSSTSPTRQDARHLLRASVVAAMFGSYSKAKGDATKFWSAVRDETGETPNLPDRKLARMLHQVGVSDAGSGSKYRAKTMSQREMYVKCIHAWNAWRKGENTEMKYYPDKDIPAIR